MFVTLMAAASTLPMVLGSDVTTTTLDLSTLDLAPMVSMINSAVPAVLNAIIPIVGIRKVIGFILGAIKGA